MAQGLIALTGATGFVGRYVAEELIRRNIPVRILVRSIEKAEGLDGAEICLGDLEDAASLGRLLEGVHTVIHCAGAIQAKNTAGFNKTNVSGMARVITVCTEAGVKRFVHISTMAAREPKISDYASSKREGEHLLHRREHNMEWVIFRPPVVYGPRDVATLPLMKLFLSKIAFIPGNEKSRISLIYVEDLARAIVTAALAKKFESGKTHELHDGTKDGYSWKDLVRLAEAKSGRDTWCFFVPMAMSELVALGITLVARIRGKVPMVTQKKIHEIYHVDWVAQHFLFGAYFDWKPTITFTEGFSQTIDWYRQKKWL